MSSPPRTSVAVWPAGIRILHAALILSVLVSTLALFGPVEWHQPAGYAAAAVVALRTIWGLLAAPRTSALRFSSFVKSPGSTLAYARLLLQRREPRYIGHNPLGGWMVLALLGCVAGLACTGWLYTTDLLWGDPTVEQLHLGLAWALAVLVVLHLAGVIFTSWRQRENLVRAMLTGRKRPPTGHDLI